MRSFRAVVHGVVAHDFENPEVFRGEIGEELRDVERMPASLEESLDALESDHEFLLKGDVFTQDLIDMWLDYKREHDVQASRLRPTPFEYFLYYDV